MEDSNNTNRQRKFADPAVLATIEAEIERIQALASEDVRGLWRRTFKKDVPKALTRDLLVRMLTWHIQEQAFGGHDRATLRILDGYAKGKSGGAPRPRRLKPGTEIVREYEGERHTVVVTAAGYRWREGDYPSLTAIARIITGTSCNGPRFFGLRPPGEGKKARSARSIPTSQRKPVTGPSKAKGAAL